MRAPLVAEVRLRSSFAIIAAAIFLMACGQAVSSAAPDDKQPLTLRLGYFPNLTHAPALAGIRKGYFAAALGSNVTIETHTFNAGGDAITAILSNSIDASFVGPSPTTNAFIQSHGLAVRVIAGATSGGALLVVKPTITSVLALKGKKIADPQLGATQDVALRWFLKSNGLTADTAGGGDVSILPQDNAQTLTAFKQGQIDGAWVPEPWASRLVVEGKGTVLVDERNLWPQGKFVTTNLVVRADFLQAHPKRVKALLEGLYQAIAYLNANPTDAQSLTNDAVAAITGNKLASGVVSAAWPHLAFTIDPLAATLKTSAEHAQSVGLLPSVNLKGLYDLSLLNQVLAEHNQPAVAGL
jgi:NitT/TauT family transport system substrate-binding protein